jgi:hypothetical protein
VKRTNRTLGEERRGTENERRLPEVKPVADGCADPDGSGATVGQTDGGLAIAPTLTKGDCLPVPGSCPSKFWASTVTFC